ncbi:hypothetical protein CPC08DRAFT_237687 [Agrocybe pediades]|nr:hypothetical protein CPC08DRAFT_237687 [Agrocybe pediades]
MITRATTILGRHTTIYYHAFKSYSFCSCGLGLGVAGVRSRGQCSARERSGRESRRTPVSRVVGLGWTDVSTLCRVSNIKAQNQVLNQNYNATGTQFRLVKTTRIKSRDWFENVYPGSYSKPLKLLPTSAAPRL